MADKLVGQDIIPQDLVAKITGRARYAEDFRADGMVFAKLLSSPMPHAHVRRIDASEALAMGGVLGILTADEVPSPEAPGEAALTMEPLYEGEAILALAAVDETTASDAIEKIRIDFEPLPFVLNPLDSLRPGGPNGRTEGNTAIDGEMTTLKWTEVDFAEAGEDRLPLGQPAAEWSFGDLEAGFDQADLILDETIIHQSLSHHCMEPRSCMAYWQNGKLYMYGSTQSVAQTRASLAEGLGMDMEDLVVIGEYCGGGFGSKIRGSTIMQVPALLSRKLNRPVMLRITRAEETYLGRARPGFQARARFGFRSDGRMTALDLYVIQENGPYGLRGEYMSCGQIASLAYQPGAMRQRGLPCSPTHPRSPLSGDREALRSQECSSRSWTRRHDGSASIGSRSAGSTPRTATPCTGPTVRPSPVPSFGKLSTRGPSYSVGRSASSGADSATAPRSPAWGSD